MNHREAVLLLPWYDNQKLEGEELKALGEHISQCESCRIRLENLRKLARGMTELMPQDAELAPDFFERRLKPLFEKNQPTKPSWVERLQHRIQSRLWWILGPVTALIILSAASPFLVRTLVRQFSQPSARLLLAEAPRAGIPAIELREAKRGASVWQSIAVSSGEDFKRVIVAVNLGPDDPEYSKYLFRLFRHQQDSEALSQAETEAADEVDLYLKVSGLQSGHYVLRVYGRMDSEAPDPKAINTYPFEIIRRE